MAEPCVRSILADWLRANGYDGLTTLDCGCGLDDLAPCGGAQLDCVPAYRREGPAPDGEPGPWYSRERDDG